MDLRHQELGCKATTALHSLIPMPCRFHSLSSLPPRYDTTFLITSPIKLRWSIVLGTVDGAYNGFVGMMRLVCHVLVLGTVLASCGRIRSLAISASFSLYLCGSQFILFASLWATYCQRSHSVVRVQHCPLTHPPTIQRSSCQVVQVVFSVSLSLRLRDREVGHTTNY